VSPGHHIRCGPFDDGEFVFDGDEFVTRVASESSFN